MRHSFVTMSVIAALATLSSGAANADIISATYTVVGSNFTSTGAASPYTSITESFTITFDNTKSVSQQTTGISFNPYSTITPTSTLGFTYIAGADLLTVGGTAATVATADRNSTDFALTIGSASNANFSISSLSYTIGTGVTYNALTRVKGTPPTAVPEPTSMALLVSAAAMVAFARRRRTGTDGGTQ